MIKKTLFLLTIVISCTPQKEDAVLQTTDEVRYATAFHFEKNDSLEYLVIDKPWPNAVEKKRYLLGEVYEKIVCTSTSHLPYFEMLGMEEVVVGFPSLKYISSQTFIDRAEKGLLTDLGPDGSMNMELLLSLAPDAVVAFDMGGESTTLDKIEESNIPVLFNSDFLEQSPLGRAEWIKFFGALLNKRKEADSIFLAIEKEYIRLQEIGKSIDNRPTILDGVVYGDTWFLPGGRNWASTFFKDAGGEYLWENDTTSGWLELSFESVYEKANDADYWIGTSTINTKNEMLGQDVRYEKFTPFLDNKVYNYNKRIGPNGGYDFFESGYSRPDLVLSDLIKILHPELLPEHETYYFKQLE